MALSRDRILECAAEYQTQFPEEEQMLEKLPEAFDQGTWGWDEIEWIVIDWKLDNFPTGFSEFPENDIENVRGAVGQARQSDSICAKIEAFTENEDITGVGVPVATAILLFMDPDRFTVIDQRAIRALREFGYIEEDLDSSSIEDYLIYLGICRALAAEYDVELRELDQALWMIGDT